MTIPHSESPEPLPRICRTRAFVCRFASVLHYSRPGLGRIIGSDIAGKYAFLWRRYLYIYIKRDLVRSDRPRGSAHVGRGIPPGMVVRASGLRHPGVQLGFWALVFGRGESARRDLLEAESLVNWGESARSGPGVLQTDHPEGKGVQRLKGQGGRGRERGINKYLYWAVTPGKMERRVAGAKPAALPSCHSRGLARPPKARRTPAFRGPRSPPP